MGGGRPLSSFDELLSMAVLTASWWTGVVECLFDEVLMDVRFKLADQRSSLIWQNSWHAKANCWEISLLCWRTDSSLAS